MNTQEIIGLIVAGIGLMVGAAGWLRNHKGDDTTQGAWMGTVNAKLDHITHELTRFSDIRERIAVLERDMKTVFKKIDERGGK